LLRQPDKCALRGIMREVWVADHPQGLRINGVDMPAVYLSECRYSVRLSA
jgi:hypothetical protein